MSAENPDSSNLRSGSSSTAQNLSEVKSGPSLSKSAKAEYGNATDWPRIFEANTDIHSDPNKIYPAQKLRIPPNTKAFSMWSVSRAQTAYPPACCDA